MSTDTPIKPPPRRAAGGFPAAAAACHHSQPLDHTHNTSEIIMCMCGGPSPAVLGRCGTAATHRTRDAHTSCPPCALLAASTQNTHSHTYTYAKIHAWAAGGAHMTTTPHSHTGTRQLGGKRVPTCTPCPPKTHAHDLLPLLDHAPHCTIGARP